MIIMADFYAKLILANRKTLDDVPEIIREEVSVKLNQIKVN